VNLEHVAKFASIKCKHSMLPHDKEHLTCLRTGPLRDVGCCVTTTPHMAEPDFHPARSHNVRLGIVLFLVYLAVYTLFVGLSAFRLDMMSKPILGGVNLAIVYEFAPTLGASLLAMLYLYLCKDKMGDRSDLPRLPTVRIVSIASSGTAWCRS